MGLPFSSSAGSMSNKARIETAVMYNVDIATRDPGHSLDDFFCQLRGESRVQYCTNLRPNPNVASSLGFRVSSDGAPSCVNLWGLNSVGLGNISSSCNIALVAIGWIHELNKYDLLTRYLER